MIARSSVAVIMMTLAARAVAAEPATPPTPIKDPVVCRSDQTTGTRFAKRVCMKKSEWDGQSEAARANAHDTIDARLINPKLGNGN
jgi:hypothetical protein